MRVHVIQHVPFEGPAAIAKWAKARGHSLTATLALTEEFPRAEDVDLLAIMGGPMDADDEVTSPWLSAEKQFVAAVIARGTPVLGVCLGAQIVAEAIGGGVRRMGHREIGWYPVWRTKSAADEPLFSAWNAPVTVGHWHGDTFDLPPGIEPALSSEACTNQAFVFDGRVVGVQFHLEWTEDSLAELVAHCSDDLLVGGPHVMTAEQIAEGARDSASACNDRLFSILDKLAAIVRTP